MSSAPFVFYILGFAAGVFVGYRLTWLWMQRQWRHHPENFHRIVDQVIERRGKK